MTMASCKEDHIQEQLEAADLDGKDVEEAALKLIDEDSENMIHGINLLLNGGWGISTLKPLIDLGLDVKSPAKWLIDGECVEASIVIFLAWHLRTDLICEAVENGADINATCGQGFNILEMYFMKLSEDLDIIFEEYNQLKQYNPPMRIAKWIHKKNVARQLRNYYEDTALVNFFESIEQVDR